MGSGAFGWLAFGWYSLPVGEAGPGPEPSQTAEGAARELKYTAAGRPLEYVAQARPQTWTAPRRG
jgi:hypothetical protein